MSSPIDDPLRQQLDALLDGALPEAEAAELQVRIDGDPALHAEYLRRRRTVELVRALPPVSAPDGFTASVLDRLPERSAMGSSAPPSMGGGRTRSLWWWGSGLAAAAALVIAVSLGGGDPAPSDDWTLAQERPEEAGQDITGQGIAGRESGFSEIRGAGEGAKDAARKGVVKAEDKADVAERSLRVLDTTAEVDSLGTTQGVEVKERIDSEADAETEFEQPVPKGSRRAEAKGVRTRDRPEKRGTPVSLMLRVEQDRTVLTAEERGRYLESATRAPDETLRAHLVRVGMNAPGRRASAARMKAAEAPRTTGKAGSAESTRGTKKESAQAAAVEFEFAVTRRSDADALRKLLTRAFPPAQGLSKTAKPVRAQVALSETASAATGVDSGEIRLDWSVSARHADTMAVWVRRIGLRSASLTPAADSVVLRTDEAKSGTPGAPNPESSAIAEGDASEEDPVDAAPPVQVRVRILFGPQPRKSEPPKGEDK